MKNGQLRDTDNTGHTRRSTTKNKTKINYPLPSNPTLYELFGK